MARSAQEVSLSSGGSTGSRLISGDHEYLTKLERRLAEDYRAEAALIFPSGYMSNLGVLSSLPQRTHTILYDRLIHASLRDGIRLSGARAHAYAHNDLDDLARKLDRAEPPCWVVTESIFSMDGDLAPLSELANLCAKSDAALIVDEAHALGWLGPQGKGLIAELGLEKQIPIRILTFGKGPGAEGAAVLGSQQIIDYLVNFSRPFIYSTAPGEAFGRKLAHALDRMAEESTTRAATLMERIVYFRANVPEAWRHRLAETEGPIQILRSPGALAATELEGYLRKYKIAIRAIRHPTVPEGAERLRVCLHAHNTEAEIDLLTDALAKRPPRS